MRNNYLRLLLATAITVGITARAADDKEELSAQTKEAIELFKKADSEIKTFFASAKAYAVFPEVAKGAIGIGGAGGSGQLFEGGKATGRTSLAQATIGFQLGGQVYSEVIFFENDSVLADFKKGKVKFSAQVSAVAAAEGVARNAKYQQGIAIFTLARGGLMYEASVGGQKFKYTPYK